MVGISQITPEAEAARCAALQRSRVDLVETVCSGGSTARQDAPLQPSENGGVYI